MSDATTYFYRIDRHDCICHVNGTWLDETGCNNARHLPGLERLEGKPVFDQFGDAETRMIYAKIFQRVRASGKPVRFNIHCDALNLIRILETSIIPLDDDGLAIGFRMIHEQTRDPAAVLAACGEDKTFITMCSYCGDLKDSNGEWQSLEREISDSDLFAESILPKISHGICPDCATNFLAQLKIGRTMAKDVV